ncbi:TetR/AcrR family transcriptional regulator [Actinocrispum wychmicini]|uniref:TetR family transcriptional regulator n=1 Tax=Actinocrispum wychmicini TaxID=1213861 RepID=A0A4R2JLP8_9PSEU|nr:TetR/AcrR family transcriptional regulator [Actinocrispum wychmicini]TCO59522.1 TetR family transcriptional regulator [Actinocrispum wychmicini]
MTPGPRERLITSAIALVRERGVHATGLTDLLEHSGTARGSIYQHFPGGKTELVEAATLVAGKQMDALLRSLTTTRSPQAWLDGLIQWWRDVLETTSFRAGCPVAAAALASSDEPTLHEAAAEVFNAMRSRLAGALAQAGLAADTAGSLAGFVVSALEGAIIQARATRSTRPLDDARTHLGELLRVHLRTAGPA